MRAKLPDILQPRMPPGLNIKIIGAGGGIGSKLVREGCLLWASLNTPCRVVLIDGDSYEPANASRMFFSRPGKKAAVLRENLLPFLSNSQVTLLAVEEYLTTKNAKRLIRDGDVVFVCVDNHQSRKLLVEHVRTLQNVVVISGGNDGVEVLNGKRLRGTYGTVTIWIRQDGGDVSNDLCRLHPEISYAADKHPDSLSCGALLTSVPQLGLTNSAVALALLNSFLLLISNCLFYSELCLDIAEGRMQPVLPLSLVRKDHVPK